MSVFYEAYKSLNKDQKEAVDAIEGPVMVIAGPGTGKTQILTLRIANILRSTDTPPEGILALTYTDAGVHAMRERLVSFIGAEAYKVRIHTYHSFALSLVHEYGEYLPRLRDGMLIDEVDQRAVLEEVFDSVSVPLLSTRFNPYRGIGVVARFIEEAKRELYTPSRLRESYEKEEARIRGADDFMHTKGAHAGKIRSEYVKALSRIEKNMQAVLVYEAYEELLAKKGQYDFQDVLLEVVAALVNEEVFRQMVQEQFLYILADEHQDANATQNEILLQIASFHESPNIFVVGDEKQAIYRFQGADLDTFLTLKERYPGARIILLETNYRSTQEVLDTAHALIQGAPIPDPTLRKELIAHQGGGAKVSIYAAEDYEHEVKGVVGFIEDKVRGGVAHSDIAVLVRTNKDAFPIAHACARAGIPYTVRVKENVLEHPFGTLFIHLLRGVWDLDAVSLGQGVFVPGVCDEERFSVIGGLGKGFKELSTQTGTKEFAKRIEILHEESRVFPAARAIPHIVSSLDIVGGIGKRSDAVELYEVLEALLADVERFTNIHGSVSLGAYLDRIERIKLHDLAVVAKQKVMRGVQIMTAHSSKGLEFPYVVIPFATDARYGKKRAAELAIPGSMVQEDHDERRLLYVALTRAKNEALITYAKKSTVGREELPTRFLHDMESLLEAVSFEVPTLPLIPEKVETTFLEPSFIRERLLSHGISATAYGNFKASPWKYFVRNLLRLPEGKSVPLIYGSAVHKALEAVGKEVFAGGEVDAKKAKEAFEAYMEHAPLTKKEREEYIPQGISLLEGYLNQATFPSEGKTEYVVSVPLEVSELGEVTIRGTLDRIDIISGKQVRVLDYKTGKVKSENEIRGLVGSKDPSYYIQLLFYALLLKYDPHGYHMEEGVIEFVEPNQTGKYVSRTFAISNEELVSFEEELKRDLLAIANGTFLNVPPTEDYEAIAMMLAPQESAQ